MHTVRRYSSLSPLSLSIRFRRWTTTEPITFKSSSIISLNINGPMDTRAPHWLAHWHFERILSYQLTELTLGSRTHEVSTSQMMQLKVVKYAFETYNDSKDVFLAQYATNLSSISSCTIFPSRIFPKAGRRNMYDLIWPRIICTFQFRAGSLPDCREIVLSYITHIETLGKTWDELSAGFAHLANHPMSF